MKIFAIAKAFVLDSQGRLLTMRRSQTDTRRPGEWDFPGGWVEEGEDTLETVKREALEEVGLELVAPKLIYGMSEVTEYGSGTWMIYVAHVTGTPSVTLSFEHDDYRWVEPQALFDELSYERQRRMLGYAIEHGLLAKA